MSTEQYEYPELRLQEYTWQTGEAGRLVAEIIYVPWAVIGMPRAANDTPEYLQ